MLFERDTECCLSTGDFVNGGRNGFQRETCIPDDLFIDDYQLTQIHRSMKTTGINPKIRIYEGYMKENLYNGFSQVFTDGKHIRGRYEAGLVDGAVHIKEKEGRELLLMYNHGQLAGKQYIKMPNNKPISYVWLNDKQHGGVT